MTFEELQREYETLHKDYSATVAESNSLKEQYESLEANYQQVCQQLAWFRRQIFGKKSERHIPVASTHQEPLFQALPQQHEAEAQEYADGTIKVKEYTRSKRDSAVVKDEELPEGTFPEQLRREDVVIDDKPEGVSDEDIELDCEKATERLAEKPGEYYVIRTKRKIYKLKSTGEFVNSSVEAQPLGRCKVDISFVVLLVIKKFLFHLPLYRQHLALKLEGIKLDRSSFSIWVIKLAKLLRPIAEAIKHELLLKLYLHIDETPIEVGRGKKKKGKSFDCGYFWPLLHPEVGAYFEFRRTKAYCELKDIINGYCGTIVSDAADVYSNYTKEFDVPWQLCWQHIRRNFFEAKVSNPVLAEKALGYIRELYRIERDIKEESPEKKSLYRQQRSQPVLDEFKEWLKKISATPDAITDDLLSKAIHYVLSRWDAAVLFVHDGNLPIDNGADERALKPVKLGFKNFLFCASEVGAEAAGIFYTLIASAKMHGIHPYYYLLDVARRIGKSGVTAEELVPQRWKEKYFHEAVPQHLHNLEI